jgi:predicted  nucleic acid-binding Zn-ribbon protein
VNFLLRLSLGLRSAPPPPVFIQLRLNLFVIRYRQAKALQSSLQALAERIDAVKSDHDKLENENKILQDYIGGLTRNMTKSEMTRSTKARKVQK